MSGPIDIDQFSPAHEHLWSAHGESSSMTLEKSKMSGTMQKVTGELFEKQVLASRFSSDTAQANQATENLKLVGGVVVSRVPSESGKSNAFSGQDAQHVRLLADQVAWLPDRKMIEARGNVRVVSDGYTFGPVPIIWATPDLTTYGSPDTFMKEATK